MQWTLVGLGNPGSEFEHTRHNVGRDFLMKFAESQGVKKWKEDSKLKALTAKQELFGAKTTILLPDTYMNKSGLALQSLTMSKPARLAGGKALERLVVLQDELDLPLGKVKISFGSSSGGHKGIDSIQKIVRSKDFIRIRIGISQSSPKGKLKKPLSEETADFVLGKFKPKEQELLKVVYGRVNEALEILITEGRQKATMVTHSKN